MIVVVDDHVDSAAVLGRLLRAYGYESAVAHCAADALDASDRTTRV